MKKIHLILTLIFLFNGCANKSKKEESSYIMNLNCAELKKEIQDTFDSENYEKAIDLYKSYEKCLDDKEEFLTKIALLYKANNQTKLSNQKLSELIDLIENQKNINITKKSIAKAKIYSIMDNKEKVRDQIDQIDKNQLNKAELEEFELLELLSNQGEYISVKYNTEFELFE
jgi:hypothetical protein